MLALADGAKVDLSPVDRSRARKRLALGLEHIVGRLAARCERRRFYAHPGVLDVAVVGLPHEKWGEGVTAFVIPKDPDNVPTGSDIIDFCRGKMAGFKRPQTVYFLSQEEMPRTGSGKIKHRTLRERYYSGR